MKKLLGSTLALAMFLPAGVNAEILKNLKLSGDIDVQATSANNITDFRSATNDRIGSAITETMLKADWDLLDDVHAHVTVVKGNGNDGGTVRAYGTAPQNVQTATLTSPIVEEANIKIDKVFGAIDTTIGRQFFGDAGDLVMYFGPQDNYGMDVSALDSFRFDWSGEHMGLVGIAGKKSGGSTATDPADVDIAGLIASCKGYETHQLSIYLLNQTTHATGAAGSNTGKDDFLYVLGIKGKVNLGGFMGKAEIAKDFGQNRVGGGAGGSSNYDGWALLLNAAYKVDVNNLGGVTPWGEFGYGSGRSRANSNVNDGFVAINTDYRPGGIYGRFDTSDALVNLGSGVSGNMASNGLANRVIYGVGVKANPAAVSKLTAGVQWYKYAFARTSTFGGQVSRNIGSEVDVTGEWKHSENVSFKLTLGEFMTGAFVNDTRGANAGVNPAMMAALDTSVKF